MTDLVQRLRSYQKSWADSIKRLDSGEFDNGIMTSIRLEQHDTWKKAADMIERLTAERDALDVEKDAWQGRYYAAAAERDALKKDAERYRHLRMLSLHSLKTPSGALLYYKNESTPEELDAAIDTAMEKTK